MTFVLMLAATAAAAVAVGLVVYWLTVLAVRTLDRLAPYWYVRYIVAGRKMPPPMELSDEEWYPFAAALGFEHPYDWQDEWPGLTWRGGDFTVTSGEFTFIPSDEPDGS